MREETHKPAAQKRKLNALKSSTAIRSRIFPYIDTTIMTSFAEKTVPICNRRSARPPFGVALEWTVLSEQAAAPAPAPNKR